MKLLLLSDTHYKTKNLLTVNTVIKEAFVVAQERKVDAVVHLGDVFNDREGQPLAAVKAWEAVLDQLPLDLHVIPGNHDKVLEDEPHSYLDAFKHNPRYFLHKNIGRVEEIDVDVMPYFNEVTPPCLSRCLLAHIALEEYNPSFKTSQLKVSDLAQYSGVFIGHFHNRKSVTNTIHYIGAALPQNFGEKGNEYGYCLIDTQTGAFEYIRSVFRPYLDIKSDSVDEIEEACKKGHVRVLLDGKQSDYSPQFLDAVRKLPIEKIKFGGYESEESNQAGIDLTKGAIDLLEEAGEFFEENPRKEELLTKLTEEISNA